jgi:hypothetical protein
VQETERGGALERVAGLAVIAIRGEEGGDVVAGGGQSSDPVRVAPGADCRAVGRPGVVGFRAGTVGAAARLPSFSGLTAAAVVSNQLCMSIGGPVSSAWPGLTLGAGPRTRASPACWAASSWPAVMVCAVSEGGGYLGGLPVGRRSLVSQQRR